MRMLAFAPGEADRTSRPAPLAAAPRPVQQAVQQAAVPARAARPVVSAPAPESAAPDPAPAAARPLGNWADLLGALKLAGMAKQLAQHCELVGEAGEVIELRLAPAHKHLAEKGPQERLRAAVEEHLGRSVRLKIEVADPLGQTPAQLDEIARRDQLANAAQALDADPFVRELVDDLGARVVPDSIKPKR
jgi:DNA polymerase-3 subunit gamma/tau